MATQRRSPFGEIDAESESRASGGSGDLDFAETPLAQRAMRPETYLIVGRRGAGKTTFVRYLTREYGTAGAISMRFEESELYAEVLAYMERETMTERELAFVRLQQAWELALWRMIFRQLPDRTLEIAAVGEWLRGNSDRSPLNWFLTWGRDRHVTPAELLQDERFVRARDAVLAIAGRRRMLITIDSREQYDTANSMLMSATAALLMYASDFQTSYGPRGLHLKLFMAGEVFRHLAENVLLNPAKTIRQPLHLIWEPRDLLRLIGRRVHRWLDSPKERIDWADSDEILGKVWRPCFGSEITNAEGLQERTFTYVLRHTQSRPRQLIFLCNEIARQAMDRGSLPPVPAEALRLGVARGTTTLAAEVLNSYQRVHAAAVASFTDPFAGFPMTFTGAELDRLLRDHHAPRQLLVEMGVVGRIHEHREADHTLRAEFEYTREDRLILGPRDECVIHPMFHARLNIRRTTGEVISPFISDIEGGGDGPARPYYRQVRAFLGLTRRAESGDPETLVQTFVNVGTLMTLLSTRDHQIVYGRRGTGKTHALRYLAESKSRKNDVAVYIDLREIGSTGGIYPDPDIPVTERATRLLKDVLGACHDGLRRQIVLQPKLDLQSLGPAIDELADAITEVVVTGTVQTDHSVTASDTATARNAAKLTIAAAPAAGLERETTRAQTSGESQRVQRSGVVRNRVHFGRVGSALRAVVSALAPRRVWILLDEWSVVPADLQPLLADLIRRSLFPITGLTVKVGAIEQRTHLQIRGALGDYVGIELGADAAADVNLDDFLVYEHNPERATEFFLELLFRHVCAFEAEMGETPSFRSAQEVLRSFSRRSAFEELVRAAEGVPRDAINILSLAAQRAGDSPISTDDVRSAAKTWYQRDKEAAAASDGQAHRLLTWIADEVIGQRRTRGFLLRSDERHPLIESLFDARVLHILKRNIPAAEQPGVRYNAYKIDYGCYVDLLTTPRRPGGLFAGDDERAEKFIDVPPDDDRAIRRAILDIRSFEASAPH